MNDAIKPKYENVLMKELDFDVEDLAGNRDGYMTKTQQEKLRQAMPPSALLVGLFLLTLVVAPYFTIQWLLSLADAQDYDFIPMIFVIIGAISIPSAMVDAGWKRYRTHKDLRNGTVDAACGSVNLQTGVRLAFAIRRYNQNTHELIVDGVIFQVSEAMLLAVHNGAPYCVYYAPSLKKIMSIEELIQ